MRIHLTIETIANGFLVSADPGASGPTFFASEPDVYAALPEIYAQAMVKAQEQEKFYKAMCVQEERHKTFAQDPARLDRTVIGFAGQAKDGRNFIIGADQPADQETQQQAD